MLVYNLLFNRHIACHRTFLQLSDKISRRIHPQIIRRDFRFH